MSRRIASFFVAAVLIASALAGYGAISHSASGASSPLTVASSPSVTPAIHPAISQVGIATYNGRGTPTTTFCTGSCTTVSGGGYPGGSTLYFSVTDTTADQFVNVTINDPNATRDGLTNPVFFATVGINQTTHENVTPIDQHLSYTFPGSLAIGGLWNITASAPLAGVAVNPLTILTFGLEGESQPTSGSVVIPGQSINVVWLASASGNGATYTHLTSVTATGTYTNGTLMNLFTPGLYPLPVVGADSWSFSVPGNATYDTEVTVEVWAVTNSSGYIAQNDSLYLNFWVGQPQISGVFISSNSGCGGSTQTLTSGSFAFVCISTGAFAAGHGTFPAAGMLVQFHFWNGIQNVTPPNAPSGPLTTTLNSPLEFSFQANAPPFSSYYVYPFGNFVNVSLSDPLATTPGYFVDYSNYSFEVLPPATSGVVTVTLNALNYDVGQTVFANWSLSATNSSAIGPLVASLWVLVSYNGNLLATAPITSTAQSGLVEFALPSAFVGSFTVGVIASNASASFVGVASADAEQPVLLVSQPFGYYTPGETLLFPVEVAPAVLPGTAIYYNLTGIWYSNKLGEVISEAVVAVGTVASGGMIAYTVPSTAPPEYYYYDVWAQSPSEGVYASASGEVELATGFTVQVGITTPSSYSDGSFQPGQTIQLYWALSPIGTSRVPGHLSVELYFGNEEFGSTLASTSTSGIISITIPSSTLSGLYYFDVYIYAANLYGPNCFGGDYCYGESGLTVNSQPSALNMELGAGSGITVGWLILLIIIVVIAVLLVLMIRRGRSPKSPPSSYRATPGPMSPPAPAPSGPGAAEWKESSPPSNSPTAGDAPPPLPTPPSDPQ